MDDVSAERDGMENLKGYRPSENRTRLIYDLRGNLLSITDAEGRTTRFNYDEVGNLTGIEDAEGNETEATFDDRSRPTRIVDPAGRWMAFEYDDRGRLAEVSSVLGAFRYEYDATGFLSRIIAPDGTDIAFVGRRGRVREMKRADGARYSYTYDLSGRRVILEGPRGMRRLYEYDELGRLVRIASLPASGSLMSGTPFSP